MFANRCNLAKMAVNVRISVKYQLLLIILQVIYGVLSTYGLMYMGCFTDNHADRDLPTFVYKSLENEPVKCISECSSQGYTYAGLQNRKRCDCGDSYGKHGQVDDSECARACPANDNYKCGGNDTNSVYRVGATSRPSKPLIFSPKQGMKALSGHVIATEKSIASVFTCISYCDVVTTCKSINYDAGGHVCELNNATASEGSTVESRGGLIYYAPDNNVETNLIKYMIYGGF